MLRYSHTLPGILETLQSPNRDQNESNILLHKIYLCVSFVHIIHFVIFQDTGSGAVVHYHTGFRPLITDTLGVIHTYITGLLLPPSPDVPPMYVSLPPISQGGEGQLVTIRGDTRQQAFVQSDGRTSILAGSATAASAKQALLDDFHPNLILYPTKDMTVRQLR